MIQESNALVAKITDLIIKEKINPIGAIRALSIAANAALMGIPRDERQAALQLAKSELEYNIEEAGGLVEQLKEIIKEQGVRIALMEMKDEDDSTLQ